MNALANTTPSSHTFSVPTGFGYYNGCDGVGNDCTSADCAGAFHKTDDYGAQRQGTADNVSSCQWIPSFVPSSTGEVLRLPPGEVLRLPPLPSSSSATECLQSSSLQVNLAITFCK